VSVETPAIETEALTKRYGRHRGIEDVTFAVRPGEVFGFLGPNGAGKTTTIRTLLDLIHPTAGSARIFGLDSRHDSVAIRARLGNLPGDFGFGREAPGRQALHLLARLRGLDGIGRAEELAARFRADLDHPLGQLSRGNRGFLATAVELAAVLLLTGVLTGLGSILSGAGLAAGPAAAGFANVWPLALLFAGLGILAAGFSLRTSVVTGSVAGALVAMYVIDLVGRLDPDLDAVRYLSVFRYYGNAIEDGIEPLAFLGVTFVACALAAIGAWLFERRDLAA